MSDTDPLLSSNRKSSDYVDEKRRKRSVPLVGNRDHWSSVLNSSDLNKNSEETYKNGENQSQEELVGFFELFQFANRSDYILMFIGLIATILHGICIALYLFLFGQITGAFITNSVAKTCIVAQQTSLINSPDNGYACPYGIDLTSHNYQKLHGLCDNANDILPAVLPINTFRDEMMKKIPWLFVVGCLQFIIAFIEYLTFGFAARGQIYRIRIKLFQSLLQRNISYSDINPTGQLNSKLFENIEKIYSGIGYELALIIAVCVAIISSLALALWVNWQLSLVLSCIIPAILITSYYFAQITGIEAMKELTSYSKAGEIAHEVFSSIRTVLSLNGAKSEQKRYEEALKDTVWSSVRKNAAFGLYFGWMFFTFYLIYAIGFPVGSLLMHDEGSKKLSITDILIVLIAFTDGVVLIGLVGPFLQTIAEAQGAAAPVYRLIKEGEDIEKNEPLEWIDGVVNKNSIDIHGDIEFENVNFSYPAREDVPILRGLNLVAHAGETTALVGSSGSGKSTILGLLLRFYEPSSGRITINNREISEYEKQQLRQKIGVVSQEPILFGTTIYENIRYGNPTASAAEIEEAARKANAHNFIMQLPNKYETLVGEHGTQLSGGEKQRVVLARAMVKQPVLLLLDEATSALDNISEMVVQEALYRACQDCTTIVIAHRLTTIQNADRIYVLANGNVVEQGTHHSLMAQDQSKYKQMFEAQQMEQNNDHINKQHMKIPTEIEEEEQQQRTFEYQRLLSEKENIDMNEEKSTSENKPSVFRRLLTLNRPEWVELLIGCITCVATGVTLPVFTILLSKTIAAFHSCIYTERRNQMFFFAFLFVLLSIFILIVRFIQFTAFGMAGAKLTERVRARAFKDLLRQEVAYFDRPENSSGAICLRLSSDALGIQQLCGARLGMIAEIISVLSVGFILGFIFSWQLTLVVMIFVMLIFLLGYLEINSQKKIFNKCSIINEKSSSLATEIIHNMRTVKQLTMEKEFLRQYSELTHRGYIIRRNNLFLTALTFSVYWSMNSFILAALYSCALYLVVHHELDLHDITMVFAFITFTLLFIQMVMTMCQNMGSSLSSANSFFKLFDRTPTIDNSSNEGQELDDFRGEISFDRVSFAYPIRPTIRILDKVQLSIKAGERVAIVGASGSGKSTFIQLLERFYDPADGRVYLDGVDIRQLNIQWVRSRFGLVSQEPVLFDLTIGENISYAQENVPIEQIIQAATKANIHEFIQQLPQGYNTRAGSRGGHLSGGEKQRIAIARALLRQPKVLLLDEATSAMDHHNEQIIQQTLEQTQADDPNRTSLIIAHRLSTIRSCDLICVLEKGHMIEVGTHDDLIEKRGVYYGMIMRDNPSTEQI